MENLQCRMVYVFGCRPPSVVWMVVFPNPPPSKVNTFAANKHNRVTFAIARVDTFGDAARTSSAVPSHDMLWIVRRQRIYKQPKPSFDCMLFHHNSSSSASATNASCLTHAPGTFGLYRSAREPRRRRVTPTPRSRASALGSRHRVSFMTSATSMPSRLEDREFR